jgi:hypothetical protein
MHSRKPITLNPLYVTGFSLLPLSEELFTVSWVSMLCTLRGDLCLLPPNEIFQFSLQLLGRRLH